VTLVAGPVSLPTPPGVSRIDVETAREMHAAVDAALPADAAVLVGPDDRDAAARLPRGLPVLRADLQPGPELAALPGVRVFAFAGIGRPAKFFDMLAGAGLTLAGVRPFPDHHPYPPEEIMAVCEAAAAARAVPVTTEKDHVRLPPDARAMVRPLSVRLVWVDPEAVADFLYSRLP
ncbi:MAG: tetraacyldisaccharide 4'-kinase, partial [Alphaproteobacteria bacterium]